MSRLIRWLVAVVAPPIVLAASLLVSCEEQLLGQDTLFFNAAVLQELGRLADTATIEHAACLLWARTGIGPEEEIHYVFYPPVWPIISGTGLTPRVAVNTDECPIGTALRWHNHILHVSDSLYAKYGIVPPDSLKSLAARACVLSRGDATSAHKSVAPATMISVTAKTWCIWTRPELPVAIGPDYAIPWLWWPIHLNPDAKSDTQPVRP